MLVFGLRSTNLLFSHYRGTSTLQAFWSSVWVYHSTPGGTGSLKEVPRRRSRRPKCIRTVWSNRNRRCSTDVSRSDIVVTLCKRSKSLSQKNVIKNVSYSLERNDLPKSLRGSRGAHSDRLGISVSQPSMTNRFRLVPDV